MFKSAIPVLHVSSAAQAEEFYCEKLGFRQQFAYRVDEIRPDPCYMGLRRDGVELHVSSFSGDGAPGGVVFLLVDDVDLLHAELVAKSVPIALEPTDQSWGNREMYVKDSDGNSIRFVREGRLGR
jgi:catechol 2,3-dioxygenase-like lactoylglutathione lyase family enzyme